jgi:hypothetical protein
MTHDYKRNGTTTLFAALNMLDGTVIGECRRGVFKSVDELKQAIMDYLDKHNGHPKPYIWTKTATEIFSKVARAKQVLESQH